MYSAIIVFSSSDNSSNSVRVDIMFEKQRHKKIPDPHKNRMRLQGVEENAAVSEENSSRTLARRLDSCKCNARDRAKTKEQTAYCIIYSATTAAVNSK
jgi:hypothetical protein